MKAICFIMFLTSVLGRQCWYSCESCSTNQYDGCDSCTSRDRGLKGLPVLGTCYCAEGSYDYVSSCKDSVSQDTTAMNVLLGITAGLVVLNLFGCGSHSVAFHAIDIFQVVSLLGAIDVQYGYPFSALLKPFSAYLLYPLLPNLKYYVKEVPGYRSYADVPNQNIEDSPKLRFQGYSYCFALNAWRILAIMGFICLVYYLLRMMLKQRLNGLTFIEVRTKNILFRLWSLFLMPLTTFLIWQFLHPSLADYLDIVSFILSIVVAVYIFSVGFVVYELINNQNIYLIEPSYKTLFDQLKTNTPIIRNQFLFIQGFKILFALAIAKWYNSPWLSYRIIAYGNLSLFFYTGFLVQYTNRLFNVLYGLSYGLQFLIFWSGLQYFNHQGDYELNVSSGLLFTQASLQLAIQLLNLILHRNVCIMRLVTTVQWLTKVDEEEQQSPRNLSIEMQSTRKFEDIDMIPPRFNNQFSFENDDKDVNRTTQNSFDFNVISEAQPYSTAKRTDL